jgi:hypothetical protein
MRIAYSNLVFAFIRGAVAQLGEHLLCKQGVSGSIPLSSTNQKLKFNIQDFLSFEF